MKATKTKRSAKPPPTIETMALPPGTEALLTVSQVSAAIGVTTRHLHKMISADAYPKPSLTIGNRPRWTVADHNQWVSIRRLGKPE
jgi:predicted DNA-binding transcriptional regulator AlpA